MSLPSGLTDEEVIGILDYCITDSCVTSSECPNTSDCPNPWLTPCSVQSSSSNCHIHSHSSHSSSAPVPQPSSSCSVPKAAPIIPPRPCPPQILKKKPRFQKVVRRGNGWQVQVDDYLLCPDVKPCAKPCPPKPYFKKCHTSDKYKFDYVCPPKKCSPKPVKYCFDATSSDKTESKKCSSNESEKSCSSKSFSSKSSKKCSSKSSSSKSSRKSSSKSSSKSSRKSSRVATGRASSSSCNCETPKKRPKKKPKKCMRSGLRTRSECDSVFSEKEMEILHCHNRRQHEIHHPH